MQQYLSDLAPALIFAYMLVFCRIGAIFMLLPGFGEVYVSPKTRLSFALLVSLIILPLVESTLPPLQQNPVAMALLDSKGVVVGLFIGAFTRIILACLEVAGMIISSQMGVSAAMMFNPVMGTQGSLISVFLTLAGLQVMFLTDAHHLFFQGMVSIYSIFPPTEALPTEDFLAVISRAVAQSFFVGLQMSAPFLVLGVIFFVGMGLLSRLMPQMQVFFIALPLQIILGLLLLAGCIGAILSWYMQFFQNSLAVIAGG